MVKNKEFKLYMISGAKSQKISETFDDCLNTLLTLCPEGREMAIVRTKLEEACFFAKKAMVYASRQGCSAPGCPCDAEPGYTTCTYHQG